MLREHLTMLRLQSPGNESGENRGKSVSESGMAQFEQNELHKEKVEKEENVPVFDVLIPTYKPKEKFRALLSAMEEQLYPPRKIIVVNTEEKYFPKELFQNRRSILEVHHIRREDFDHAYARNLAASYSNAPYFLCMTDDAVPANRRMTKALLDAFSRDEGICAVYARQLCNPDSSFDERLSRAFNYGEKAEVKGIEDVSRLGIKCFFASNVCCMYKKTVFQKLCGFREPAIFNEDMVFAARAEKAGYKVAYEPGAEVYHSHRYNAWQQFRRNFDLGVSHRDAADIFQTVPPEGEGKKYFLKNCQILLSEKKGVLLFPLFFKTGMRYLGYKLGKQYQKIPGGLVKRITLNPQYFARKDPS